MRRASDLKRSIGDLGSLALSVDATGESSALSPPSGRLRSSAFFPVNSA